MVSFESVADEYDVGRPGYPAAVFDALGPLAGKLVLEGGAGTGIATRDLVARGAQVMPFDIGPTMLRMALARTAGLRVVVADGAVLPFRDEAADLLCFAQAWHWLDADQRCAEAARVLRANGRWAGWWSHARADGEEWFDAHWDLIEARCPGINRSQRDIDWGSTLVDCGRFRVRDRITVPWVRTIAVAAWVTDQASHSYVAALHPGPRGDLLAGLQQIVEREFAPGPIVVPYETWLWIADKR